MTSRRTARASSLAAHSFRHYCSAYRRAARDQGVAPTDRYKWLTSVSHQAVPGAGLLAWSGCRPPVDEHDAALRTLAQYAPGLRLDMLAMRAHLVRITRTAGLPMPYIPVRHV